MIAQMRVELNSQDKVSFDNLCERLGMTAQDALQNFVIKMLDVGGMPFKVDVPNERLKKTVGSRNYVSFESTEEGLAYLNGGEDN
ncbi:Antitoxin component of the RelBE or YafQ-DinJ toxin-antitoxin module (RelB) [Fructobacillus fructosus]|uniref:type II toxin-antitoxin system antitoxin, RelB/DinJ family n=1 Tax=Fructobacillus fructosus TaxID=1631 RepID=UPI002D9729F3|nr:Antitoxin component of the RelBE or YafQ-DinJ toxin-antitoxin module (RelB) [Fructobacillus fructosus]